MPFKLVFPLLLRNFLIEPSKFNENCLINLKISKKLLLFAAEVLKVLLLHTNISMVFLLKLWKIKKKPMKFSLIKPFK